MAEEHRFQQAPEGHRLCANNCGFFGSPATRNLCSKCYRDFCLREQETTAKSALEKSLQVISLPSSSNVPVQAVTPEIITSISSPSDATKVVGDVNQTLPVQANKQANRCSACRKRVGLTGFRCRCGTIFCGVHRYPEQHGCSFDFKAAGREVIARDNPVVKAEKLEKI